MSGTLGQEQPRLWTGTFIALTCINFCSALVFYLLTVILTEYAVVTYDASYSEGGLTVTCYVIAAMVTRVVLGSRIDVWGVKKSLFIGFAINLIAAVLYVPQFGFGALLAIRVLNGIGFGLGSSAAAASAALIIPASRRGEGIGYFSMAQALATGVGPFVAIMLIGAPGGYLTLFIFTVVVSAVPVVAILPLKLPKPNPQAVAPSFNPLSMIEIKILPVCMCAMLALVCYSSLVSFLTLFAAERQLTDAAGLFFVVYALVILISRPPVGRRVDKKGENSIAYISLSVLVIAFVLLAFSYNAPTLLVAAGCAGFGIGVTQSTIQTAINRMTPSESLGRANATFMMTLDMGSGVGPILIGSVIPIIGYQSTYLGIACVALLAVVIYHIVHGRKQQKR